MKIFISMLTTFFSLLIATAIVGCVTEAPSRPPAARLALKATPVAKKSSMKFEYGRSGNDGQWYWRLKAGNGEILAVGEGYENRADVLSVINLVQSVSDLPIVDLSK